MLDFTAFAGDIVYERGRLVVYDADFEKQAEVPLVQIAVILIGGQTRISGGLMAKLSAEDVAVLVCDWRHVPVAEPTLGVGIQELAQDTERRQQRLSQSSKMLGVELYQQRSLGRPKP